MKEPEQFDVRIMGDKVLTARNKEGRLLRVIRLRDVIALGLNEHPDTADRFTEIDLTLSDGVRLKHTDTIEKIDELAEQILSIILKRDSV